MSDDMSGVDDLTLDDLELETDPETDDEDTADQDAMAAEYAADYEAALQAASPDQVTFDEHGDLVLRPGVDPQDVLAGTVTTHRPSTPTVLPEAKHGQVGGAGGGKGGGGKGGLPRKILGEPRKRRTGGGGGGFTLLGSLFSLNFAPKVDLLSNNTGINAPGRGGSRRGGGMGSRIAAKSGRGK